MMPASAGFSLFQAIQDQGTGDFGNYLQTQVNIFGSTADGKRMVQTGKHGGA